MITAAKDLAKRHWPRLRLRVIVFAVLFFAAAMPGLSAIFLRVYENTLVRQTEAELVAQGAAIAAAAAVGWPGATMAAAPVDRRAPGYYDPEPSTIDLQASPLLAERPAPAPSGPPEASAAAAAARLAPMIERTTRTTLASVVLLDGRGVIAPQGGSLAALPEVRSALAGAPDTVLRRVGDYRPRYSLEWLSRASGLRLHHARPIEVDGRVVGVVLLSRSPRALFRGIYEDRGKIAIGVVGIAALLVVLAGLVSRGVTRPIEELSAASRQVAAGGVQTLETPTTAAVEIQSLYEDFRAMSAAIERRSGYLRDFAASVSHEFKTPLAGISGAVELLQDHGEEMSPQERSRFLGNIAADSARLSQLVTRLLDLVRADMARPEAGLSTDAGVAVQRAADAMNVGGFHVATSVQPGLPSVAVPAATIEAVVGVLLQNSRQAGARQAAISLRTLDGQVLIEAADDGPGVSAADAARLFEPFFTTRRAQGGTGLGLSIARSLLAANGGTIELAHSDRGARFVATLPPAA